MNKSLLLLASAAFATMAVAQVPQPSVPGNSPMQQNTVPDSPPSTPDNTTMPAPAMAPMPDAAPAPAPTDSAPAPMPMPMPADSSAAPAPTASTTDYPTCSRTVMDKCVQKGGMMKHKPRK